MEIVQEIMGLAAFIGQHSVGLVMMIVLGLSVAWAIWDELEGR
jgi:hypothetical protein